ncbi:RagB/SusD family nutrient uptake outer membrane protein [Zunongwangia endophytica]|uniref:RagB/SusD family nutrient uptake outer membrane protein n=1 Tax=Zunongwangia endophytica TaxID=1808945 RepID=A0ABV8H4E3_9FLAO|nr:RagB/SusD family nutrient uptake outer membrane protein [Zunongwangia endophytica]MDN3594270.1 RagB/SusD family nutrient uptake outer membrane protein [Zunongwangia endophytica]
MKVRNILMLSIGMLAITGCEDELNLENPNSMTASLYWADEDQALAGINAVYTPLINDGYYMRMTPALTDGRADDFKADSPWPDLGQISNFTILPTSDPIRWMWEAYYQQVFRANQVLQNAPDIEMDEDLKQRILGQAYFLRGLAYFHLAINFEKVPIPLTPAQVQEDYYQPTGTEEELWTQIKSDFAQAQQMLPVDYENVNGPDRAQLGRATKGAATGFLGKAHLYQEEWSDAAAEFRKLIDGPEVNIYSLMDDYRDNFSPFSENNAESLFEVQFANPDQVGGSVKNYGGEPQNAWQQVSSTGHTYAQDGFGYSDFLPTRWIYNKYKEEETVDDNIDPRLLVTIASNEPEANSTTVYGGVEWPHAPDAIYPRKYTHDGLGFDSESEGGNELSEINYRLMRYADVLLMYAEALNELGQTQEAYQYINQVRNRANLADLEDIAPSLSQEDMRDQLAEERALEFAIESIRWHDIRRWGWLYDADKLAELRSRDNEFDSWRAGKEYLPIPQSELDVNPNAEPNSAN